MGLELVEEFLEALLVLGQGLVEDLPASSIQCAGVVAGLANVQPAPDVEAAVLIHDNRHPSIPR